MMKLLALLLILTTLLGCSDNHSLQKGGSISSAEEAQRKTTKYLSYEYKLSVEVERSKLRQEYEKAIEACSNDKTNECTVLDSSLSMAEGYSTGDIRLRIKPAGVNNITKIASSSGELISQSMTVQDLAKEIIDNEKRTQMLTMQRDRLMDLQKKAGNDIASLINIAKELSRIQSELESSTGQDKYLLQRTQMDIINIHYHTLDDAGFWQPITQSAKQFSGKLSKGISETISVTAYILPGFLMFLVLLFVTKYLWKRFK